MKHSITKKSSSRTLHKGLRSGTGSTEIEKPMIACNYIIENLLIKIKIKKLNGMREITFLNITLG